jgi:hypothetical protein
MALWAATGSGPRGAIGYTARMAQISLDSVVRIHDEAVFRELDGEAVILQLDSGMYFGLDPVGTRLWQLIEQHGTVRAVVSAAVSEFDTTSDVLEHDLLELVTELERKQLVVVG